METKELWLCETQGILLRPNVPYIFRVDPECEKCQELAAVYGIFANISQFGECCIYENGDTTLLCIPGYFPVDCLLLDGNSSDKFERDLLSNLKIYFKGKWSIHVIEQSVLEKFDGLDSEGRPLPDLESGLLTHKAVHTLYMEHPDGLTLEHCYEKIKDVRMLWASDRS